MRMRFGLFFIIVFIVVLSACLSGGGDSPAITVAPDTQGPGTTEITPPGTTTVPTSSPTLAPLSDKLYIEAEFIGQTEDAHVKFWISGGKQKTHIARFEKDGSKIIEAITIFDRPFMYISDENGESCMKFDWDLLEESHLTSLNEFLNTLYNPYVSNHEDAVEYWEAQCADDPDCSGLSVADDVLEGVKVFVLTIEHREEHREKGKTLRFWIDKESGLLLKRESLNTGTGDMTSEIYSVIEGRYFSDDIFLPSDDCLDVTAEGNMK